MAKKKKKSRAKGRKTPKGKPSGGEIRPHEVRAAHAVRLLGKTQRERFLSDPNVVGFGFGEKMVNRQKVGRPCLTVLVAKKMPSASLPLHRVVPQKFYVSGLEIETDVIETGLFYAFSYTDRQRPAQGGSSIGHINITAGTLGCLVRDNTDGTVCILSNNHVLADENAGSPGDAIVQPGPYDGGTPPTDTIARLKRFVTINPSGSNQVDAAIAEPLKPTMVVNKMRGGIAPPAATHRVVGLLFAGSCNSTVMNPIQQVLGQLNVSLLSSNATVTATVGMNVEKVGRTTEYTTSTIKTINTTVRVTYDMGQVVFDNQFVTGWFSDGGDSGSIVFEGGIGGDEDHCLCATMSMASNLLDVNISEDQLRAVEFRDQFLRQTKGGAVLVDAFYTYESRIQELMRKVSQRDRTTVRRLARQYTPIARVAYCEQSSPKYVLTRNMLKDCDAAMRILKRYVEVDEYKKILQLRKLANKFEGKTPKEALAMLNRRDIANRLEEIFANR